MNMINESRQALDEAARKREAPLRVAHPPAITDEMVERAASVIAERDWHSYDKATYRRSARAALEAALGVKHAEL